MRGNHFGKFEISNYFLRQASQEEIDAIFEGLIIVRAEQLFHKEMTEYIAYSEKYFEETPEGELLPEYTCVLTEDAFGEITKTWQK